MTDLYLRFADEAESLPLLFDGETPKYSCMDVIGTFYNVDNTDPENPIVTPIPGWCVNVRTLDGEDGTPLEPYRVDPEPAMWRRVWL